MTRLRLRPPSLRARVLSWFVLLLAVATLAPVLVLREALVNRLNHNVENGLPHEAEQLAETGEAIGGDVERVSRAFLQGKVPSSGGEAFATLVDGRPFLATPAPNDLAGDP